MAAISTTLPSMPYPVWVFILGPSSGPRWMLVRHEADGYVGIKANEKVFMPDHQQLSEFSEELRKTEKN